MKRSLTIIGAGLLFFSCLQGQYYKAITVETGSHVSDKFTYDVRFLYPQFTEGEVVMKTGAVSQSKLNFDLLLGEIEFLSDKDTLMIARKRDLNMVTVAGDTFIYRGGYLKLIHSGTVKVLLRDKYKVTDIVKKGAMGAPNRNSAIDSYTAIPTDKNLLTLVPTEDIVFRRTLEFYLLTASGDMIDFRKKNIMELYPQKESEIQKFIKSNKINFEEQADILKLADFLATL